ncbi:MAG: glycosyltransferase family 2 protein [Lachnospiraceae bacterium]|nr:glycosyltransferase family 2 protein [Lachnospiraceae bacterium]
MQDHYRVKNNMAISVDIIIPTYRPDADFEKLLGMLGVQSVKPGKIIIINTDESEWNRYCGDEICANAGGGLTEVHHISKAEFNHGHARNLGAGYSSADYFVCMTQDAVPVDESLIENLLNAMGDSVKMSYARQTAKSNARDIEKITRSFNYPAESVTKSIADIDRLGIKTFFASNVCCAYEKAKFDELGGFVDETDFNEDMMYGSKLVRAGYAIRYCADAVVRHSHNYTANQQYRRNYQVAVSQTEHPEYFSDVRSESEGIKLVKTTAGELVHMGKWYLVPELIFISGVKYLGYRAGRREGKKNITNE